MAGAGKRTFIAGEVLTAAQVNDYLMDQAVMRFSGSAARAASITAPTEGMVTYLDDTNRLYIYDGAAWQEVGMEADDLRKIVTASAQVFVGIGSGSVVALSPGTEGQVLSIAPSASTGVAWVTPQGAGAQAIATVSASNVNTALSSSLTPGFYKISTDRTTSWNSTQFRFVDTAGNFYGADLTAGNGTFTIPVAVASVNITSTTFPVRVLVEELGTITANLITPPVVSNFEWTVLNGGNASITPQPAAASFGVFSVLTGSFTNIGPASAASVSACLTGASGVFGNDYPLAFVAQDSVTGLWSTAPGASAPKYAFQVFTGNGTYTKPAWSSSVDVLVISGGGGGGGNNPGRGGGGGAGGASVFTNVATPSPVSVTVGAGGAVGAAGSNSSFGPRSTSGGGRGGGANTGAAGTGGSGGGGAAGAAGAAGTPGQGNAGSSGVTAPFGPVGGGGGGAGGAGTAANPVGGSSAAQAGGGGAGLSTWGLYYANGGSGGHPGGVGDSNGAPGGPNGGGGGGSGNFNQGTAGSDGVVIVRAR